MKKKKLKLKNPDKYNWKEGQFIITPPDKPKKKGKK